MSKERDNRIAELWEARKSLNIDLCLVDKELDVLCRARDKEKYSCSCVCLNKTLSIHTSAEQAYANRKGLGAGLVFETLSAFNDCPVCHGSGIVPNNEAPKELES